MNNEHPKMGPNPGYILGQLAQALTTAEVHESPEIRNRAQKKISDWLGIMRGILSGSLDIGSRTPIKDTPAWVTLEVAKGGFATGRLLAEGDLQPHEQARLAQFAPYPPSTERALLNSYFVSEAGLSELQEMLISGCYRITLPEEGALLVVAWLVTYGYPAQGRALLEELGSYFARLRFYPVPASTPESTDDNVYLQDVGETKRQLAGIIDPVEVRLMREAVLVWHPLYDQAVQLFIETVTGELPSLRTDQQGKPLRSAQGNFTIKGGWPCQHYPPDWHRRAQALLDDYAIKRAQHQACRKPERAGENFALLRGYLRKCLEQPQQLTGRDVGMIRLILASFINKRGTPRSSRCTSLRQTQSYGAKLPTRKEIARVVIARLEELPEDEGLDALNHFLAPVDQDEARQFELPVAQPIPESLTGKLWRSYKAPVDALVGEGIISSGEVLAKVIPQLTAQIHASAIYNPELRRLYSALYRAFRRRRSLLLLNLSSQVRLDELPWVRALKPQTSLGNARSARQTLEQVVTLTINAFPQTILPNKLLQELRALVQSAELQLPIVDELAVDIFMGDFSQKFLQAAQLAGALLEESLYETYYGISYSRIRILNDVTASVYGTATSRSFYELCCELAGEAPIGGQWSVARNGKIIEQAQIMTTHNLAVLIGGLGLQETANLDFGDCARRCFTWVCHQQQLKGDSWHTQLQRVKNSAYAWRQMVFYLSLLPSTAVTEFLTWANAHLAEQPVQFQTRFHPALAGLVLAAQGISLEDTRRAALGDAKRLLGWTTGKHWLLGTVEMNQ